MRHEIALWLYKCSQTQCDDIILTTVVIVIFGAGFLAFGIMPIGNGKPPNGDPPTKDHRQD